MNPSIAIVIPTHNRPFDLSRALDSVYGQAALPDEIIVVDDGSRPPVQAEDIFAHCPSGPRAELLTIAPAGGANAARNAGLRLARSDYVAFLDDDDECLPDRVAMLRSACKSRPDIVHHGAEISYDNENISYFSKVRNEYSFNDFLVSNIIGSTSVACVRRDYFLEIGGFDETLPALQDWEAWMRAARNGARFESIDAALTRYHFVTGKQAISKSMLKLNEAIGVIEERYRDEFDNLGSAQRRRAKRTRWMRFAHRYSMNGMNFRSSISFLRGAVASRDPKLLAASLVTLFGVRYLAMMRARLER